MSILSQHEVLHELIFVMEKHLRFQVFRGFKFLHSSGECVFFSLRLTSHPCPAGTVWSASWTHRQSWSPWQRSPRKHLSPCRPAAWVGSATRCWHCNLLNEQTENIYIHMFDSENFLFLLEQICHFFHQKLWNFLTSENSESEHHKDLHDWRCSWKTKLSLWGYFFLYTS